MTYRLIRHILLLVSIITAFGAGAADGVLSGGRWVKISVDTTGIYQIGADELRAHGFTDPASVHVYGYGGVLPHNQYLNGAVTDTLPLCPSLLTSDGRLVFYAEGPVRASLGASPDDAIAVERNYYDNAGYYFLSDKATGAVSAATSYTPSERRALGSHYCIELSEREAKGFQGGAVFHGPTLRRGDSETASFDIADITDGGRAYYTAEVAANASSGVRWQLKASGDIVTEDIKAPSVTANSDPSALYNRATGYATFTLAPGVDSATADFTLTVPTSSQISYAAIDRSYVVYPRANRLRGGMSELMLNIPAGENPGAIAVESDTDAELWDVTDPANVIVLGGQSDGAEHTFTPAVSEGARRLVAFNPSAAHRGVTFLGEVAGRNLRGEDVPDMLIITTGTIRPAADELAAIHRADGLRVLVVTQDDAYDEFGSGARTPAALRRMVKMFYDRAPGTLRYLLLYGAATWDPRFISVPEGDYLPTFECELPDVCRDGGANYGTDMYYGMLADKYNPARIEVEPVVLSIGRLPARDLLTARQANAKIQRYISAPPPAANMMRVLRSSDNDNDGVHLLHAKVMTDTMQALNDRLLITRADLLYYPDLEGAIRTLHNGLHRGAGYFHYNGHGGHGGLTGEGLYSSAMAKQLKYSDPGLMMFSSCSAFAFDLGDGSLSEVTVLMPDGGAIGSVGSTRSVYLNYNRLLSLAVSRTYATATAGMTGADIYRAARDYLLGRKMISGYAGHNTLCYNYCGDPAVRLPFADYDIVFDTPAATTLETGTTIAVRARVVDGDGNTVTDFSGDAFIEVFDGPQTHSPLSKVQDVDSEKFDDYLMAEFPARAVNGVIETSILLPDSYSGNNGGSIVASAVSGRANATGRLACPAIVTRVASGDNAAPEVLEFYIDPADFVSADNVGTSLTVHAVIDPSPSGIAMGSTGVRDKLSFVLDESTSYRDMHNRLKYDSEGLAHISLALDNMAFGPHTLRLSVPNNAGVTVTRHLCFTVSTPSLTGRLSLDADGPARDSAVLSLDAAAQARRLIVTDADGETVVSAAGPSFPYTWDLRDKDGHKVPDGLYRAWVILESDLARGSTEAIEITVVK